MPQAAKSLFNALRWAEGALLALLLSSMIGLGATQVLLRNFFDSGLYWGDSAVRVMVLWVAMLGAMVASRNDEHIRIDLANRLLPAELRPLLQRFVNFFTFSVLIVFAWYSFRFVQYEYEDGMIAFANVPAWLCEAIMPFGAAVMACRYALHTIWPKQQDAT